jgi:hypothetical protein
MERNSERLTTKTKVSSYSSDQIGRHFVFWARVPGALVIEGSPPFVNSCDEPLLPKIAAAEQEYRGYKSKERRPRGPRTRRARGSSAKV